MNPLFRKHEIQFIAWFSGIFLASIALLAGSGLLPDEFQENTGEIGFWEKTRLSILGVDTTDKPSVQGTSTKNDTPKVSVNNIMIAAEDPIRIVIPKASVDFPVLNPSSTNSEYLDSELKRGVVRYPGSGYPGAGNMFIFGHSTGLQLVQNKAFKVFNNLKNLQVGDEIQIYSSKHVYIYTVRSVKKVDKNDTWVKFDGDKNTLTLSTCDSFGKKSDRYVVIAEYTNIGNVK